MNYYGFTCNDEPCFTPCGICPLHQIAPNIILSYSYEDFSNMYRIEEACKRAEIEEQVLKPLFFKISYPIVRGLGNEEVEEVVNSAIVEEVSELFKAQVLRMEKTNFTEVNGFYEITLNEKGLLSILFGMYTYVEHAAHGYTAYSSLTIDLETGKIYKFEDLFNPKVYYKGILDELAKEYIRENDIQLISEYEGITPNQEFYLTPDELVLYYQLYEYTPYVYGLFKIPIPYTKIQNILGPLSPIQRLL